MDEQELKKLLLETCPVRPGQEARAWKALRDQLYGGSAARRGWSWLFVPTWRGFGVSFAIAALVTTLLIKMDLNTVQDMMAEQSFATADSQAPGIYATAFYSKSAQAQVVWLNGMEPATDRPTYLEPTTVLTRKSPVPRPASDPNSL